MFAKLIVLVCNGIYSENKNIFENQDLMDVDICDKTLTFIHDIF